MRLQSLSLKIHREHSLPAHGEFFNSHHPQVLLPGLLSVPFLSRLLVCLGLQGRTLHFSCWAPWVPLAQACQGSQDSLPSLKYIISDNITSLSGFFLNLETKILFGDWIYFVFFSSRQPTLSSFCQFSNHILLLNELIMRKYFLSNTNMY